jgi:hypothetical protein
LKVTSKPHKGLGAEAPAPTRETLERERLVTGERGPYLTAIVVCDAEKPIDLLDSSLTALEWLHGDVLNDLQLILVNQGSNDSDLHQRARTFAGQADVVNARHEIVGGKPLWNVLEALNRVRPLVLGRYLTVWHKEYVPGPGALSGLMTWLKAQGEPFIAAGNLRRLGEPDDFGPFNQASSAKEYSDALREIIADRDEGRLGQFLEVVPNLHWPYVVPEDELYDGQWHEDMFFARTDWVDAVGMFEHHDRMYFQDIFDLVKVFLDVLKEAGLCPPSPRVPLAASRFWHLYHLKPYHTNCRELMAYFAQQPEWWEGTRFTDWGLWAEIARFSGYEERKQENFEKNPIGQLRWGELGTGPRYADAVRAWLGMGGANNLMRFYLVEAGIR